MVVCTDCQQTYDGNRKACPEHGVQNLTRKVEEEVPVSELSENGVTPGDEEAEWQSDMAGEAAQAPRSAQS